MPETAPHEFLMVEPATTQAGKRLDKALAEALPEFSRARVQALIAEGRVALDGAVEVSPARKLRGFERIKIDLPAPAPAVPQPEAIALAVLHEDADLIVIDKPAGLVVHPAHGHGAGTLVNALIHHCGASLSGINGVLRPGIVHRLDKDTTGLIVVAKNDRAHRHLAAQFADHGRTGPLERQYRAIVWGAPARRSGTIDAPIARSSQNREKMVVSRAADARFAITHYDLLATRAGEQEPVAGLIACRLETGRTHQIRVHMTHIGHPILGDSLYGTGFRTKALLLPPAAQEALAALGRQALHAETLGFEHPGTGAFMRFNAAPPADFARLEAALFG